MHDKVGSDRRLDGDLLSDHSQPVSQDREGTLAAKLWWVGLALMLGGLVAPLLVVEVPPLADYPNHLARGFFLAFGTRDPVMQQIFAPQWDLIPNLASDLILPPLMHLVPPLLAGKLLVALAVLLPTTGSIALSRACFGQLSLWQLGSGFVAYNAILLAGMLNFQLAVGIALWGAAAWIVLSPRSLILAAAVAVVFAVVAFVFHLFGFFFFAVLIGCAELAEMARHQHNPRTRWGFALRRGTAVVAVLLLPILFYSVSPLTQTGGIVVWLSPLRKIVMLIVPVLGYQLLISLLTAAVLATLLLSWAVRGRLRIAPLAWAGVPTLLVVYTALPLAAKGGYFIDTRIPVMLGFMAFATLIPWHLGRSEALLATVVLSVLFFGRVAHLAEVWAESQRDVSDVRQVLAPVAPGSRLLVVEASPSSQRQAGKAVTASSRRIPIGFPGFPRTYWHYGAFAFIDHRAFWSSAFTIPGVQPIRTRAPYNVSGDNGVTPPPDYTVLLPYADAATAPEPTSYLVGWPSKFDYILLLNAELGPNPSDFLPMYLVPLEHKGIAALFSVKR